jgi:hypothetical protein
MYVEATARFTTQSALLIAAGHLPVCLGLGYRAGKIAVYPYWDQITNWVTNLSLARNKYLCV